MTIHVSITLVFILWLIIVFTIYCLYNYLRSLRRKFEMKSILYDVYSHTRPYELSHLYIKFLKKGYCMVQFQIDASYAILRNITTQHDGEELLRLLNSYEGIARDVPGLSSIITSVFNTFGEQKEEWFYRLTNEEMSHHEASILKPDMEHDFTNLFEKFKEKKNLRVEAV